MAKNFSDYISAAERPAKIALGVVLGKPTHALFDKLIDAIGTKNTGTTQGLGLLGAGTTTNAKKYISPLLVAGVGIFANYKSKSDLVKQVGTGMTTYGVGSVASQFLFGKPLFSGDLKGGFLGDLIGDDEELEGDDELYGDDEELEGDDDDLDGISLGDFEEEQLVAALPPNFDVPVEPAITRDAPWERETIGNFSTII